MPQSSPPVLPNDRMKIRMPHHVRIEGHRSMKKHPIK